MTVRFGPEFKHSMLSTTIDLTPRRLSSLATASPESPEPMTTVVVISAAAGMNDSAATGVVGSGTIDENLLREGEFRTARRLFRAVRTLGCERVNQAH
jgi:hypothetical protein